MFQALNFLKRYSVTAFLCVAAILCNAPAQAQFGGTQAVTDTSRLAAKFHAYKLQAGQRLIAPYASIDSSVVSLLTATRGTLGGITATASTTVIANAFTATSTTTLAAVTATEMIADSLNIGSDYFVIAPTQAQVRFGSVAILDGSTWGIGDTTPSVEANMLQVYSNDAHSLPLINFKSDNSSATGFILNIENDGSGGTIKIDQAPDSTSASSYHATFGTNNHDFHIKHISHGSVASSGAFSFTIPSGAEADGSWTLQLDARSLTNQNAWSSGIYFWGGNHASGVLNGTAISEVVEQSNGGGLTVTLAQKGNDIEITVTNNNGSTMDDFWGTFYYNHR